MKRDRPSNVLGWSFSILLLLILFYIVGYLSQAPYAGFIISKDGKTVLRIFDQAQQGKLLPGDKLVSINEILVSDYIESLSLQYWTGVSPGDQVPITFLRDGKEQQIAWVYPGKTTTEFMSRFISPIWLALLLWGLGISAYLTIQTKDSNRFLILAYNFIFSIGFVSFFGPADYHMWYSAYLVRICEWIAVLVLVYMPWSFPDPFVHIPSRNLKFGLAFCWSSLLGTALYFDLLHPHLELNEWGIFFGLLTGIIILSIRVFRDANVRKQFRIFFLLTFLAYLSGSIGLLLGLINFYVHPFLETLLYTGILLCPVSIFYTIWSGKLPQYQFKSSRSLATALYSILIIIILMMLLMVIENTQQELNTISSVILAIAVALVTIQTYPAFTRFIDRVVFRIPISSKDLLQSFSRQLDRTKDTASISSLMSEMILPTLLVRQSALIEIQTPHRCRVLDRYGILESQIPTPPQIDQLIKLGLRTVPPQTIRNFPKELHWIRVVLPLIFDDQIIGLWLLGQRDPNNLYDDYVVDMLQALAQQTTIAMIHHRKSQRLTTLYKANIDRDEEERAKLARDLHDDTLNDLALLQRESKDPALSDSLTRVINSLRKTINGLRPEMLSYGLVTALTDLGDALNERQNHAQVVVQLDGAPVPISPNVEQHLYRIVQQACENALRHSQADLIRILGIITEKAIHLTVVDNGIGFNVESMLDFSELIASQHFGLAGMHERADLINANLSIQSSSDQGTRISIYWKNPQFK